MIKDIHSIIKDNDALRNFPKIKIKEFLEGLISWTKLLIVKTNDVYAIALQSKNGKLEKSLNSEDKDVKNKIIKIQNIPK